MRGVSGDYYRRARLLKTPAAIEWFWSRDRGVGLWLVGYFVFVVVEEPSKSGWNGFNNSNIEHPV